MTSVHEIFLKHFDSLISKANELPPKADYGNYELRAKFIAWETSCLNILEKTFGLNSNYYVTLKDSLLEHTTTTLNYEEYAN